MTKIRTLAEANQVIAGYLAVWSEPDPERRRRAVEQLWTTDGAEYVEGLQFRGHDKLFARVSEAYEQFIESGRYRVAWGEDASVQGDSLCFTIQLITVAAPSMLAWSARVFLLVDDDGRIREDYQLTVQPLAAA